MPKLEKNISNTPTRCTRQPKLDGVHRVGSKWLFIGNNFHFAPSIRAF